MRFFRRFLDLRRQANINSEIASILNAARSPELDSQDQNQAPSLSSEADLHSLNAKLPGLIDAVNQNLGELHNVRQNRQQADYDNYSQYRDNLQKNLEKLNHQLALCEQSAIPEDFLDRFARLYKKVESQYPFYKRGPQVLQRLSLEELNEVEGRTSIYQYDHYANRTKALTQQGKPLRPSNEAWEKAMKEFLKIDGFRKPKESFRPAFLNPKQSSILYTFSDASEKEAFLNCLRTAVAEEEREESQAGVTIGSSAPEAEGSDDASVTTRPVR